MDGSGSVHPGVGMNPGRGKVAILHQQWSNGAVVRQGHVPSFGGLGCMHGVHRTVPGKLRAQGCCRRCRCNSTWWIQPIFLLPY